MKLKISCPGKIILMGEHAVVYGRPAIVAAVNRRMTMNYESRIKNKQSFSTNNEEVSTTKIISRIPIGCGMGSSAALSVILAASHMVLSGMTELTSAILSKINQIAHENEKIYHTNPSGVDPTICTYGGILWYQKLKSGTKLFKKLEIKHLPKFILINTGKPEETTGEMVQMVSGKLKKEKNRTNRIFDVIEEQTKLFLKALTERMAKEKRVSLIKNCIQNCESCLEDLGIVGQKAKEIVREIEENGGVAKVSGGGGTKKGSGILLCFHENPEEIIKIAKKNRLDYYQVKLGVKGLTVNYQ